MRIKELGSITLLIRPSSAFQLCNLLAVFINFLKISWCGLIGGEKGTVLDSGKVQSLCLGIVE